MSNYLAIATVTATLQRTLQAAIQTDVYGARVTTFRPNSIGGGPSEAGVNIFLYQVMNNPAFTNPVRAQNHPTKKQVAIDLYYILSFYGNETELEPQRILGSVVRTFSDQSILSPDMIRETLADPNYSFLEGSDLADQLYQININLYDVNLDELSKAWSTFFQSPYLLSIIYRVMIILIDGKDPGQKALPVRSANMGGMVAYPNRPLVDSVRSQGGILQPILTNSTLLIQGRNLKSDIVKVRIGGTEVVPSDITNNQILLPLTTVPIPALKAGVQSLQVVHQFTSGIDGNHRNVDSNAAAFILRPTVINSRCERISENNDGSYYAEILVEVNLSIRQNQRVVLGLNEWIVENSQENPKAYLFDAVKLEGDSHEVMIIVDKVEAGEYLVRLMVDGAESQLDIDNDSESPTFNFYIGPKIVIR
ncbi:DUF4255 domain-containing protein [Anabaena sp. FACHB-1237]|uniref:DUF4255 domain-containing protein n=1 Tax=Anabaena sp. FACHB-1237 TaxID=2692769 RepID=UPI001680632D|nr:DUF4255 domain-containing protein [Anabaena sp. FACHB-1237]MBD2137763.1 DUF4255 domain-containing protein [Anabaena sp. FACHB-1237]